MLRTFLRRALLGARPLLCGCVLALSVSAVQPPRADASGKADKSNPARSAALEELRLRLDAKDLESALAAVQRALSEVGDGATYAWSRSARHLRGVIKPTATFRDADGQLCRHLIYSLTLAKHVETVEGIACRQLDGAWALSG